MGFVHSQTTDKLVNEAANISSRVSGQDRKKPPALGTNQIAGFGGFRPLASLEKKEMEDITWPHRDMRFLLSVEKHFTSELSFRCLMMNLKVQNAARRLFVGEC